MAVRQDLFEAWARGWALTRGAEAPEPAGDGWRIEVGQPDQIRRFVFSSLSHDAITAAERIDRPHILIKVCDPEVQVRRPARATDGEADGLVHAAGRRDE